MLQLCCILASLASPIMNFNDQTRYLSRREDEGGASAPTLHPHHSRPYNGYELPILFVNVHNRGYVLDKSALYSLNPTPEAALERSISSLFQNETEFFGAGCLLMFQAV